MSYLRYLKNIAHWHLTLNMSKQNFVFSLKPDPEPPLPTCPFLFCFCFVLSNTSYDFEENRLPILLLIS